MNIENMGIEKMNVNDLLWGLEKKVDLSILTTEVLMKTCSYLSDKDTTIMDAYISDALWVSRLNALTA